MRFFACVVGANCNSPLCCCVRFCLESLTLQFTHISNSPMFSIAPHVEGRITIRPYACVIWTFANIDVNTCKYTCKYTEKHHGHGVSMFAHVVGAICKSPLCCCVRFFLESLTLQIRPCYKFAHVFNHLHVGGLIAISPYTCVFLNVRKYVNTCKYTKKHYGHGVSMFAHVVGANWNSPTLQFALMLLRAFLPRIAHIAIHPCRRANCN